MAAAAVIASWLALRHDHETKVARIVEAVSYATRSELARNVITQFRAFRDLADFWAAYARLPRAQWRADARIELAHFEGVDVLAWSEPDVARFFTTGAELVLDHVPTAEEWESLQNYLEDAHRTEQETTAGPEVDSQGHAVFRFYKPVRENRRGGVLIAVIDAQDLLAELLLDEAPGYDIRVTCCGGTELYRRGVFDRALPAAWTRDGWIEPAPGLLWNVAHRPSRELAADLAGWVIDAVLVVGLTLALLLGAFVHQTFKATDRAAAASDAERRVRALNRELETRVALRTQDLNDVLDDINTINLSVSHDLRSPLNAISLLTQRLRQEAAPGSAAAEHFDRIAANVGRMTTIMDRLLGFSRASSFEYEIQRVDMRELARHVVEEHTADGARARITIGQLPPAEADPTMVHSLLTNLLSNALKHARTGAQLHIEIGCRERDGAPAYFVKDDGAGFDSEIAAELFKPMKRAGDAADGAGLGLGLAIAARIVERHGGRIWAESAPGRGATFLFTLTGDMRSMA